MTASAAYVTLEELAGAIGDVPAARLVAALGGERIYVPRRFRPTSEVVRAIGQEAADRLSHHIVSGRGGLMIEVPRGGTGAMADFRRKMDELCQRGDLSAKAVARLAGTTTRSVHRRRAQLQAKEQLPLFGDELAPPLPRVRTHEPSR